MVVLWYKVLLYRGLKKKTKKSYCACLKQKKVPWDSVKIGYRPNLPDQLEQNKGESMQK